MRLEDLTVELRPRSPWEAVELGTALVRRHARTIWAAWFACTLPVFALANLLAWGFDAIPWAGALLWWLKPVFDRIPLYVLSRAVFGAAPSVREAVAAQRHWGWRPMLHYLSWRRAGMARSLYLPVDLLEGGREAGARRRVIGGSVRGTGVMLTVACAHFEMVLAAGVVVLGLLFVPVEFLSESAKAVWALLFQHPPAWAQLAWNAILWLASSLVEPFYVGAGFGLYLNRRTQLEAWDLEIAFRRMRARLQAAATLALLACALLPQARAAQAPPEPAPARVEQVFGAGYVDEARFARAARVAYQDPLLGGRKRVAQWVPRTHDDTRGTPKANPLLEALGRIVGFVGETGLWLLLAVLVLLLAWKAPRWWPWLRDGLRAPPPEPSPVVSTPLVDDAPLPADVVGEARRRWRAGQPRAALALVYRASVESMAARTGVALVPGATEAECLRAARALAADEREAFAGAVKVWQYAAYAERLPAADDFEALLARLALRFGWAA
ncbi:MAG: DUF4129 domain-containing protein [Lysobacteraceae bacterium]